MKKTQALPVLIPSLLAISLLSACGSPNKAGSNADECEKLIQEADALKGKPLQRSAVMERWEAQCT